MLSIQATYPATASSPDRTSSPFAPRNQNASRTHARPPPVRMERPTQKRVAPRTSNRFASGIGVMTRRGRRMQY